jgi:AraC-like DNA-binding protein
MTDTSPTSVSGTPVSSCAVANFTDPDEYQEQFPSGGVTVTVTAAGNYQANLTRVSLPRLEICEGWTSLPRIARSVHPKGRNSIGFLIGDQQGPTIFNGTESPPGAPSDMIGFYPPGAEVYLRTRTECRWGALSVAAENLASAGRALTGRDLTAPDYTRAIRLPANLMSRMLNLHQTATQFAATVPDLLTQSEVGRAIEQELLRVMVGCLTEGQPVQSGSRDHRPGVAIMKRFEEATAEARDRPLYLTEICAKIGVPDRTLRAYCQEHLGLSPQRYLWLRRMNLAQRALLQSDPKRTTVTQIATGCGFGELGRFSVRYRQVFGESPSTTLRRAPKAAPPRRRPGG